MANVNLSMFAGIGAQLFNNSGKVLAGGKIYTYLAGTTTPATTYTTSAGTTAHSNPIVLDSAGRVSTGEIWLVSSQKYKFVVKTSLDVAIATYDNVSGNAPEVFPFKLTEGSLLSTPELGAVEYVDDGTTGNVYATVTYHGITVRQDVTPSPLIPRKPRSVIKKIYDSESSSTVAIKVLGVGDSLSGYNDSPRGKLSKVIDNLSARIGGHLYSGKDCDPSVFTGVTTETGQYQYSPIGIDYLFTAGSNGTWVTGAVNPTFTTVSVYYIKEPGAGTLTLTVGGSVVGSASASNATVALGVLTYTQSVAQASVALSAATASVRVLSVHYYNSTIAGIDFYTSAIGGLLLQNSVSTAQGRALWQSYITLISPDLVTFEFDDDFGDDGADDAALNYFTAILDAACPYADKLFIGSTPRSSGDYGKIISGQKLKSMCASKDPSYLFFDNYAIMGSYADMIAIFGSDDGTHPSNAAATFGASCIWEFLGLNGYINGYTSRPVFNYDIPSILGRNSKFVGGGGNSISLETDASFGTTWTMNFPGVLTFTGTQGAGAGPLLQLSTNTSSAVNILPDSWSWGSSSSTKKLSFTAVGSESLLNLTDTGSTTGYQAIRSSSLYLGAYTKATLPTSNSRAGCLVYVSDGSSGGVGCMAYSRGEGPTIWRRVVDDSIVL